jgi:hypothetical protein
MEGNSSGFPNRCHLPSKRNRRSAPFLPLTAVLSCHPFPGTVAVPEGQALATTKKGIIPCGFSCESWVGPGRTGPAPHSEQYGKSPNSVFISDQFGRKTRKTKKCLAPSKKILSG